MKVFITYVIRSSAIAFFDLSLIPCIDLASSYDLKQKVHVLIYLLSKGIQMAKKRKLMSYYLLYNYELNIYL